MKNPLPIFKNTCIDVIRHMAITKQHFVRAVSASNMKTEDDERSGFSKD